VESVLQEFGRSTFISGINFLLWSDAESYCCPPL
jgi:hypothetical protein